MMFVKVVLLSVILHLGASLNAGWWEHAVIYQIYPRSFKDSNNDGIGDLQGVISKMEYLRDTGIDAVWLSPIYKSPQVDQGYDISDFRDIDEDYGTMEDFEQLLKKAKQVGVRVLMDFVPNHSSDKHEWFLKSENREPGFEDFYVWRDGGTNGTRFPNNWLSMFGGSAWTWNEKRQQYYLHQFAKEQPDLNYRNPAVRKEMKDVLKYWLDKGVAGFRMDAVPFLVEDPDFKDEPLASASKTTDLLYEDLKHIYTLDQEETFALIYEWRSFLDEYSLDHSMEDERIMITEAYTDICNTMIYYGNHTHKGSHFTFNFFFITGINKDHIAKGLTTAIVKWIYTMSEDYVANWVLGNHDQHRVATRLLPENVDGFNMFSLLLPGVAVTYNGEEIGQENGEVTYAEGKDPGACNSPPERFDAVSRDFQRTPLQWDNTTNAGFNQGAKTWLPVSQKYRRTNLMDQLNRTKSHYGIYKALVQLRKQPVFREGSLDVERVAKDVVVISRTHLNDTYYVIFNTGGSKVWTNLDIFDNVSRNLGVVLSSSNSYRSPSDVIKANSFYLDPHECIVVGPHSGAIILIPSMLLMFAVLLLSYL